MHKILLTFDLYRIYGRAYDGVLLNFDGNANLEDILNNDLILNQNFTIDNFHFDKASQNYLNKIRAEKNQIIQDVKDYLNTRNLNELFFETIHCLNGSNKELQEFYEKYLEKFN